MLALSACVTSVRPPAAPDDPRPVFLLVLGYHSNLVLTTGGGKLVRYGYGDWQYYAAGNTGLWRGMAALLWPTPAALGRRELQGPATEDNVRRQVPLIIYELYGFDVSGDAVDALRAELDAIFVRKRERLRYRAELDLWFVPHPVPYTAHHNSNRVVVDWLRKLGCETQGGHLVTRWRVMPAIR